MSQYSQLLIDTNAFEYLDKLGLCEVCFQIISEPLTSDLIRQKEIKKQRWDKLEKYGLKALSLSPEQMSEAYSLKKGSSGPSIYDTSLAVLGREYGYPVFTEDQRLIRLMREIGVVHVSPPEMIDSLVQSQKISDDEAVVLLRKLALEILTDCQHRYREIYRKYFPKGGLQ